MTIIYDAEITRVEDSSIENGFSVYCYVQELEKCFQVYFEKKPKIGQIVGLTVKYFGAHNLGDSVAFVENE